ncbi:MAG TPA: hypothetical protein VJT13_18870, partial [Xanthobacteraceae bacterium]|nr:hypothetical protein [Xanthobacteraceae bacterium]
MSTPVSGESDPTQATMYAPPWARGRRDAAPETPQDAQFGERRTRRRETPFEGDVAIMQLRAR